MISSEELVLSGTHFCYSLIREDFRMVYYEAISTLVNRIPLDTWDVLGEIKERRPGMMLSELIDCRRQALKKSERLEPPLQTNEAT
jgi:hypothetical protein